MDALKTVLPCSKLITAIHLPPLLVHGSNQNCMTSYTFLHFLPIKSKKKKPAEDEGKDADNDEGKKSADDDGETKAPTTPNRNSPPDTLRQACGVSRMQSSE